MAQLLATLQRDPFTTAVGQLIEQATDASLASENWALNMEICDMINDTDEGPKDAMKAIRKRLQQSAGKNYTVVMYTLTVVETCVKNCGRRFHVLVAQKDFVQELVKLIGPKNDPPTAVQEKVLSLIQTWSHAFRANPDMQGVMQVYTDLKAKGVEFPPADLEAMAPIHTPQRSVPMQAAPGGHRPDSGTPVRAASAAAQLSSSPPAAAVVAGPVQLTPDQLNKLKHELDIVQRNMTVFGEMLSELTPGHEHHSDWELLQELQKTCHAMQTRMVELLDKVANEQVTSELLRLNDEMNNLFLRYERFEKRRSAIVNSGQQPARTGLATDGLEGLVPNHHKPENSGLAPLIDLDGPESAANQLQNMNSSEPLNIADTYLGRTLGATGGAAVGVSGTQAPRSSPAVGATGGGGDEFDAFALSRGGEKRPQQPPQASPITVVGEISKATSSTSRNPADDETLITELHSREGDFDEMATWLSEKPTAGGVVKTSAGPENITSSEFDRFLAERAAAADRLPTIPAATGSSSTASSSSQQPPPAKKDGGDQQGLFAL